MPPVVSCARALEIKTSSKMFTPKQILSKRISRPSLLRRKCCAYCRLRLASIGPKGVESLFARHAVEGKPGPDMRWTTVESLRIDIPANLGVEAWANH